MTNLLEAIQRAADEHPRQSRRVLTRQQAERVRDVVLDAVKAKLWPIVAGDWSGNEVFLALKSLRSEQEP